MLYVVFSLEAFQRPGPCLVRVFRFTHPVAYKGFKSNKGRVLWEVFVLAVYLSLVRKNRENSFSSLVSYFYFGFSPIDFYESKIVS